jgi:hypothetical protein
MTIFIGPLPLLMDQTTGILPAPLGGGGPSHKLDSDLSVVQAADHRLNDNAADALDGPAERCIFAQ